jgi:hypothetical protein
MSQANQKALEPTFWDGAHRVARAITSAVPLIGGPATELFSTLFTPPLEKRRDEWLEYCLDGLRQLEEQFEGFKIQSLTQNEAFITSFVQATHIAISTHQREKREVLRNAVLNSASPTPPDEDMELIFLSLIEVLTPWHLRLLRSVNKLWGWPEEDLLETDGLPNPYFVGKSDLLEDVFPELKGKHEFYDLLLRDLVGRGLLAIIKKEPGFDKKKYRYMGPTPTGLEFRKFIASPLVD